MKNNPKISIIIPTYNRAHPVGRAIQSVSNQTYQDFELIIVDDDSIDNTDEVIKEFQQKDNRIIYLKHHKNKGGSAARNTGIKASKGEYIAFLDSDDEWLPEKLEKQIKKIDQTASEIGIIYTGNLRKEKNFNGYVKKSIPKKKGYIYKDLLIKNYVGTTSSLLIKRECFNKVGYFDKKLPCCQDYDFCIRLAKYYKFEYVPEALVKCSVHDNQISSNLDIMVDVAELIMDKYMKEYQKYPLIYSKHCFEIGNKFCHYVPLIKEGRKYLLKAVTARPFFLKYWLYFVPSFFGARFYKFCVTVKRRWFV